MVARVHRRTFPGHSDRLFAAQLPFRALSHSVGIDAADAAYRDFILVNKYDYGIRLPVLNTKVLEVGAPQKGDIIVFRYPMDESVDFIKRVVATPGDRVEYRDKVLYVNGVEQAQSRPRDLLTIRRW